VDKTVVGWHASWLYVSFPVLAAAFFATFIPRAVAVDSGWIVGVLVGAAILAVGVSWSWALRRMYLLVTLEQVIVQNIVSQRRVNRSDVLGVEASRSGVYIWYRDGTGVAAVNSGAAQGSIAGDFRRSRIARIADELQRELGVAAPDARIRRQAQYD